MGAGATSASAQRKCATPRRSRGLTEAGRGQVVAADQPPEVPGLPDHLALDPLHAYGWPRQWPGGRREDRLFVVDAPSGSRIWKTEYQFGQKKLSRSMRTTS